MHRLRALSLLGAVFSVGCLDTTGSNSVTLNFDFTNPTQAIGEGWTVGVADVPESRMAEVAVADQYGNLPPPWAQYTGIAQGGTSIDGKLFLFHKKWISSPWPPGRRFSVRVEMSIMSNQATGCTGGPGPAVFLKAGASGEEPTSIADAQGILRFNLDKGTVGSGGRFALFGNITNGTPGCPADSLWNYIEFNGVNQAEELTIDPDGGFWIFMATESTFSGSHRIYLLGVRIVLRPLD